MDAARPIVGTAECYSEFIRLCRARIEALNLTYGSVDALCTFPDGYCATLLSGGKAMSVYSFFTMASALGLTLTFTHDEEKLARLRSREDWIAFRRKGKRYRPRKIAGGATRFVIYSDFYKKIGRKGALAWHAKRIRRRNAARRAAMARWGNNGNHPPK
jgi:hypothetical protein